MRKLIGYVWQALFVVIYPFLTLFSVFFTVLIRLFSFLSSVLHRWLNRQSTVVEPKASEIPDLNIALAKGRLVLTPLKEIHFGPQLYVLSYCPQFMSGWLKQGFSNWVVSSGNFTLLQHWPQTEEHELSTFNLVLIDSNNSTVGILKSFTDFDWVITEFGEDSVRITCNGETYSIDLAPNTVEKGSA